MSKLALFTIFTMVIHEGRISRCEDLETESPEKFVRRY